MLAEDLELDGNGLLNTDLDLMEGCLYQILDKLDMLRLPQSWTRFELLALISMTQEGNVGGRSGARW